MKGYAVISKETYELARCGLLLVPAHICVTLLLVLLPYLENFNLGEELEVLDDMINILQHEI